MATNPDEVKRAAIREIARRELARRQAPTVPEGTVTTPFQVPKNEVGLPPPIHAEARARQIQKREGRMPEVRAAAASGVDVTSGAPAGRTAAGFAENEALQAEQIEKLLTQHFGQPVSVRRGPESGKLEFLNPETKRFTLVDEARVTLRDLLELAGPTMTAAGAVAGEILGGPPGAAAGAAVGEAARRSVGNVMGVREESAGEVVRGAAGAAAVEGVASGAGNLVSRGAQGVRNIVRPQPLTAREAERVLNASEANQAIADEISRRTGERLQPFTGQMSDDPLLLGGQAQVLNSRQTGVETREQLRQNETVLEQFFDIVTPSGGGPRTAVGRAVQEEARSQTQPRVDAIDAGVRRQVNELESLTATLPKGSTQQIGSQIRQIVEEARATLKGSEDSAWDGVRRSYGFNADTALSQYKVPIDGELATTLKRLQTEAAAAIDPATAAGKAQLVPEGLTDDTVDLHQLQTYLSSLRRRERISRQNVVATDPEGRDISRVRDALLTQRNAYLKSVDPELLAELEAAEDLTATRARLFDKGVVGGLLRKADGQYVVNDSEVVGRTIGSGNPEAIQHLVNVFGTHPAGVATLQGSMLATYRNEVVQDGLPRAQLHQKFIENHGAALDALFPKDAAGIRKLGEFEKIVTRNIKRFEDFQASVEKSFRGRIQDIAPERIAEQALSNSFSVKDVARIVALAGQAGYKEQYQRAIGDQIRRRFINQTSGINLNSLDKFVEQNGEKLYAIFGEQYIRDMRMLLQGLKTVRTTAGGISVTRNPTLMESLARSTVARPLSAPGVALTRLMRFRDAAGERLLARAITDPDALRQIIAQRNTDMNVRKTAQLLAVLGASSLAVEEEE